MNRPTPAPLPGRGTDDRRSSPPRRGWGWVQLTRESAELAVEVPVATDITVEADSGGHTDNRPLTGLLPVMLALRNSTAVEHPYRSPIRIGAAGGLGTPTAVAAAFALGADYVLTGSINQSAVEAGTSPEVKRMLADLLFAKPALLDRGISRRFSNGARCLRVSYRPEASIPNSLAELRNYSFLCHAHTRLSRDVLGLKPDAAIGLSTGESSALFCLESRNDPEQMFDEIDRSGLYATELDGEFRCVREAWNGRETSGRVD